jgi:DNA-binding SARP family transcriptional activator
MPIYPGPAAVRRHEIRRTCCTHQVTADRAYSRSPRSGEHLASLFWPDRDEAAARGTLRTALSRLRQAVAAAAGLPAEALTLLRTGRDALGRDVIRLACERTPHLTLDTALVEAGAAPQGDPIDPAAQEALLLAAVDAYRGPFLADITFDDAPELEEWVQEQRAFWQRQVEALLGRLAALQLERVGRTWATRDLIHARATLGFRSAGSDQGTVTKGLSRGIGRS